MIRQRTRDGRDIVEFLLRAMNDTLYPRRRLRPADRLEASRILCERLYGRVPLTDEDGELPKVIILDLKGKDY